MRKGGGRRAGGAARTAGVVFGAALIAAATVKGGGVLPTAVRRNPWAAIALLVAALACWAWPVTAAWCRRARRAVLRCPWPVYCAGLFAAAAAVGAGVALRVFGGVPHLDDAVSAVFQARVLLRGAVTLPLPPHAEFFTVFGVLGAREGMTRWCTMYPPAWPFLLVPAVGAGVPWLLNPLLGGALAVTVAALGRALYGSRTGRIAGLLCAASPFVAVVNGTHLSHTSTALCLAAVFLAVVRLLGTGRAYWGLVAGGAWGLAFLNRPLTALVVGAAAGLAVAARPARAWRARRGLAAALLLAAAAAGTLAAWQQATTGDWRTPGHEVGMGRRGKFGFVRLDAVRTHTPAIGLDYSLRRMRVVSDRLLSWPFPTGLVLFFPFLARRARREDAWLVTPWLGLVGVYAAYWYWEEYLPARYTFAAMPMLLVLAARGYTALARWLRRRAPRAAFAAPALLASGLVFSAAFGLPSYARGFGPHHGDVETALPGVLAAHGVRHAVVFMDAAGAVPTDGDRFNDFYATGFLRNDLGLRGDVVFARNLREHNAALMRAYPGRRYYLYVYDRGAGEGSLRELRLTEDGYAVDPP